MDTEKYFCKSQECSKLDSRTNSPIYMYLSVKDEYETLWVQYPKKFINVNKFLS